MTMEARVPSSPASLIPPREVNLEELDSPDSDFARLDCLAFVAWYVCYSAQQGFWVEASSLAILFEHYATSQHVPAVIARNEVTSSLVKLAMLGHVTMQGRDMQVYFGRGLALEVQDLLYRNRQSATCPSSPQLS